MQDSSYFWDKKEENGFLGKMVLRKTLIFLFTFKDLKLAKY